MRPDLDPRITALLLLALPLAAFSASEVNLYSARKENLIKPLLDRFTEQTGIKVNLVTGKADALFASLKAQGVLIKNLSPAGGPLQDCLRVTVGTPEENAAFLAALTETLAALSP